MAEWFNVSDLKSDEYFYSVSSNLTFSLKKLRLYETNNNRTKSRHGFYTC